jgi:Ca-activated chloride channel family protein
MLPHALDCPLSDSPTKEIAMSRIRNSHLSRLGVVLGLLLLVAAPAMASPDEEGDVAQSRRTVEGGEALPQGTLRIRSHEVKVVINNGFATTTVDQVLENGTGQDVEAAWAFPLPKEAALSELSLRAGGKQYVGEVVEKQRAHEIYQAEKTAGHTTAMAEQHEYFHYQVRIARVPARGEVIARIVYYQALEIESGVGRYLYPMQEGNTDDLSRAFWSMERKAAGRLSFDVTLKTAFPVDRLHSPSHPGMQFQNAEEGTWHAMLQQPSATLDRDFTLLYRLHPDVPARVEMLTHRVEGATEGTFMAVVTPGSDLAPIESGTDWAFVLDVSGSMQGEKIRLLKKGVAKAMAGLSPKDRIQIFTFNNSARALTRQWLPADAGGRGEAQRLVDGIAANGGTNVFAGLGAAYAVMDQDRPTGIILVSDGVANVGPHHYRDLIGLGKKHDVRVFTFAIGNSANERLLDDLATLSGGTSASVSAQDEIGAHLLLARERMTHTALHGVRFELPGATVIHPKTMPTLYMGQQLVVLGRYDKIGEVPLKVTARISGKEATWTESVNLPASDNANPELERLYALAAITDLQREAWLRTGDGGEARSAIVDMALRYSLVTDYTSMIVMEDERKAQYGVTNQNAERRQREVAAASRRAAGTNSVGMHTSGAPIAGTRAAHAPSRYAARQQGGGSSGGGGGGGSGALGPLHLLLAGGLALAARRRRKRAA